MAGNNSIYLSSIKNKSSYVYITLDKGSGRTITLPVNPSSFRITRDSSSEILEVIGTGEVSLPKTPRLATITITSFLSDNTHIAKSAVVKVPETINPPKYYVNWILDWQESKKYALLTTTGFNFETYVSCEKFWWEYRAGEEDCIYYELSLKEYRSHGAQVIQVDSEELVAQIYETTPARADNVEVPAEEVVTESTVPDTNPVAVASSSGVPVEETDDLVIINMSNYDVETGEFKPNATITIPKEGSRLLPSNATTTYSDLSMSWYHNPTGISNPHGTIDLEDIYKTGLAGGGQGGGGMSPW